VLVYAWTAVSAALLLDPLFGNKLAVVKDAMSMLPVGRREPV
jgi:hypothetical protein